MEKNSEQFFDIVESYRETLVIVEGLKDRRALQEFGFRRILILNKPLYAVVEDIVATGERVVVILADLDAEGKKLYSYLANHLMQHGIVVNNTLRNFLFKKTPIRHIEGLATYFCATSGAGE